MILSGDVPGGGTNRPQENPEFDRFFRQYFPAACRYLMATFGTASYIEDAAQEAMHIVWTKWELLEDEGHRIGYLFKTARNQFLRMLRKGGVALKELQFVSLDAGAATVADNGSNYALTWIETYVDLVAALRPMSIRQREVAALAWLCDFSESDIACHLGIAEGTVKTHLKRARESLQGLTKPTTS